MKVKLSISNTSALKKVVIRTSLSFFVAVLLYVVLTSYLVYSFEHNWPFFGLVLTFAAFFIAGIKKNITKDNLEIKPDGITIGKYGTIPISKIGDCKLQKGTSLLLKFKNGIELSIGPRNGYQKSASRDFQEFVDDFSEMYKKQLT